ncbi:MAG TPA: hypothetical protein GXZ23_02845 [Clostridiales bacterium]|nr:hypothetical protein [Clostridiales bacterium]
MDSDNFFIKQYENLLKKLPVKKTIIFESNPAFTDNTWPVFKYLYDNMNISKDYKIVWLTNDRLKDKMPTGYEDVELMNYGSNCKSLRDKFYYRYLLFTSVGIVCCNRILGLNREGQYSIMLQHGMPLKASNGGYCIKDNCSEALCVSEFFKDNYHKDFEISYEKMFFCGFPRTDYLFDTDNALEKLNLNNYTKVIVWLPTYRKSDNEKVLAFNIETTNTGIPTINTIEEIERVDAFLRENNMLILFKAHPVQPIDPSIANTLTNFKVIDNDYLLNNDVQLYQLLGESDALITDYSSVYYDYLLTEKPIGLTLDDIDKYIESRNFVYDDPFEILKGDKILNNSDMILFLKNVLKDNDATLNERIDLKNRMHTFQNGKSTEYAAKHIYEKIRELS